MNTRKLFKGLIIFTLLPALLAGNSTRTRVAPEPVPVPIGLNTPIIVETVGVELSPGYNRIANPGSIITYTHTLTNTGTSTDTYSLEVSSSQGWPISLLGAAGTLSLPLQLDMGLTATLLVSLTVPTAAISGTVDTAVITATSQTNPTVSAIATDATTIRNVTWYVYLPLVLKNWPLPGIHGQVTYQGVPIDATPISLQFYNGSSWSTIRTRATQAGGIYQFTDAPTLTSGQRYRVRYSNSAYPNFVAYCGGPLLSSYTAGASVAGGDFDIANIPQMSPSSGATIALPYTFQWTKRIGVPSDSYILEIWRDGWWDTGPLGYVSQYTLNILPAGMSLGTPYWWDIGVYGTDGSYCYSFDQNRTVTFSSGVTSSQDTIKELRRLHNEDLQPRLPVQKENAPNN